VNSPGCQGEADTDKIDANSTTNRRQRIALLSRVMPGTNARDAIAPLRDNHASVPCERVTVDDKPTLPPRQGVSQAGLGL
jgi:hypothetical protein